jgi:hypothetical protein
MPSNFDAYAIRRSRGHSVVVREVLDSQMLWFQYGINVQIMVRVRAHG